MLLELIMGRQSGPVLGLFDGGCPRPHMQVAGATTAVQWVRIDPWVAWVANKAWAACSDNKLL